MTKGNLFSSLVGSWELLSRIDRTQSGEQRTELSLGSDPIAFLVFDRAGHFAAQFMRRDRNNIGDSRTASPATNNSRARGGYDAYFGTYAVDADDRTVKTRLVGALSPENVGQVFSRMMTVDGDSLTIELETTTPTGENVRRTLRWKRVA